MEWFVYLPFSMDPGHEHLETVEETAKWYSSEGLKSRHGKPSSFNSAWTQAQMVARDAGWDGTFKGAPVVFWMPGAAGFQHGFAWRQGNGLGVLASPVELHHLEVGGKVRGGYRDGSAPTVASARIVLGSQALVGASAGSAARVVKRKPPPRSIAQV